MHEIVPVEVTQYDAVQYAPEPDLRSLARFEPSQLERAGSIKKSILLVTGQSELAREWLSNCPDDSYMNITQRVSSGRFIKTTAEATTVIRRG